jgi:hypothetical protein
MKTNKAIFLVQIYDYYGEYQALYLLNKKNRKYKYFFTNGSRYM